MFAAGIERVALTLWVGALWTVGYLVQPVLFARLDEPAIAAWLSGELSASVAWVSLFCAAVMIFGLLRRPVRPLAAHWRLWLVVLMLGLIMIGEFWVRPPMEVWAEQADDIAYRSALRTAESLYLVASVVGLVLVFGGVGGGSATAAERTPPPSP